MHGIWEYPGQTRPQSSSSRLCTQSSSGDERLTSQKFAQQSVHYPSGLAFGPGLCRGLHRIKQWLVFVVSVAQESRVFRWRLLLAVIPTWVVIHVSPPCRSYSDEVFAVPKLLIRFPKVHQPERQQPFPGSFLLMYAIGSVFSIASKDIVLEDMSE
jgi:hypothetical protein